MITVRVPADLRPPEAGPSVYVGPDHDLARSKCPVCDERLSGHQVTLVVVGSPPACQRVGAKGWIQAAAVAVHTQCSMRGTQ